MPQHPVDGFVTSVDVRHTIPTAYAGLAPSWWWLFETVTQSSGFVTRKFRASLVSSVPASSDLYWSQRGSGRRAANPLVMRRAVSNDGLRNIASGAQQLSFVYDGNEYRAGNIPPRVRVQVEYLDENDTVLNTAQLDYIFYDGDQRPQPNSIGGRSFDFNLETPFIVVTPGERFRIVLNQEFANSSGRIVSRIDRASSGSAWALWILDSMDQPVSATSAWKPFFRIVQFWDRTSQASNGLPVLSESASRRGLPVDSAGHPFGQWQRSDFPYQAELEIEALANVNFPQLSTLRFYKRMRDYRGTQVILYKDVIVTTIRDTRLIVPDTITAFNGSNVQLPVSYGPVPPDADATVSMSLVDLLGDPIVTDKLSVAPSTLDFTVANALTPQETTLGVASDAADSLTQGVIIRYADGERTAETAVTVATPGDTGAGLVLRPASATISPGETVSVQAVLNGDLGADATITATDATSDLAIRIASPTIPQGGGSTTIEITAPAGNDSDRDVEITVTMAAGGATRDTQTIAVRIRASGAGAAIPAALPGRRYQINGVLQSTDDPEAVSFEMDMAWAGESAFRDGAWRYLPGVIRPSVLTITPDMVIDVERCQIGPDSQDRINAATMQIAQDTSREYLPRRMAKLSLADELLLDGHEREIDMGSRAFINNRWQAARTLAVMMRRTRYDALYILRIRPGPSLARYHVHPGDIVTYTDARYNVYGSRCRVIASTINPDLSMTLSLRQESPAVYQDVPDLPDVEEARPVRWVRLFKLPDGHDDGTMAAFDNNLALLDESGTRAMPRAYNRAGVPGASLWSNTNNRAINGIGYSNAGLLTMMWRIGAVGYTFQPGPPRDSGQHRNNGFVTNFLPHDIIPSRTEDNVWGYRRNEDYFEVRATFGAWRKPTSDPPWTDPPGNSLSRTRTTTTAGATAYAYRADGSFLHAAGGRIFIGSTEQFSCLGQGDEVEDSPPYKITAMETAMAEYEDETAERLFAIVEISVTAEDRVSTTHYVYMRTDATSPDPT